MKIILICTQLEAGGAQRASVRLAEDLGKQGYDCENWFLYKKREAFTNTEHIYSILNRPIKSFVDYILISFRLYKKLRKSKADAVITFTHYANVLGLFMAWLSGVKIRVASHRNPSWGDMSKSLMAIDKLLATRHVYTKITAVSQSTKSTFDYYSPQIYNAISVIKNGLNFKRSSYSKKEARSFFNLPENIKLIGTVGRLSLQKNQALLIEAIKDIDVHLAIAGDGELKSELKVLVKQTCTEGRVHFLGEINGDQIPHLLKAIDIYVMPSLFEGLSNALVEALCAGLPIIASDIPSQRDVILSDDGTSNGVLLATDDSLIWRQNIEQLYNDENLYKYYMNRALLRSADFTMDKMTAGFKAVLHS